MKKLMLIILCAAAVAAAYGCGDGNGARGGDTSMDGILRSLREDGMNSWWDVLAVYSAGHNPMDYPGFDEILYALEDAASTLDKAAYVIVSSVAIAIGADYEYFEEYENFRAALRGLLESPGEAGLHEYIIACLALKSSGAEFDAEPVLEHFRAEMLAADGGFALEDDFITALALPMLALMDYAGSGGGPLLSAAASALISRIGELGDASTTALAISALLSYSRDEAALAQAQGSLGLFASGGGFSFTQGGERNDIPTAHGLIALGDLSGGTNVWLKLYSEMLAAWEFFGY